MSGSVLKRTFVSADDHRLRAGWRILGFLVIFMGLNLIAQAILKLTYGGIPQTSGYLRASIVITIAAAAATIAVPIARRFFDKRTFISLGLTLDRRAMADLLFGFVLNAAMAGTFFAIVTASRLIEVAGLNWGGTADVGGDFAALDSTMAVMSLASLFILLSIDVIVAWWEELVFRGYLLQNMIDGLGLIPSVIFSSVIFGVVHATNPGATILSVTIIVLFGFMAVYAYLKTRSLWLPIGMHAGWNFFQGVIFGFGASGNKSTSLIEQHPSGPDWLSGGAFGPEGSVIAIPIVLVGTLAVRWWSQRATISGEQRPPIGEAEPIRSVHEPRDNVAVAAADLHLGA